MRSILEQVVDDENLRRAWHRLRTHDDDRDAHDGAYEQFELFLADNLARLQSALRCGTWQPSALVRVEIPKKSGGMRVLHVSPLEDRVVERAIAQVLGRLLDPSFSPWSYGYRPGLGVSDALAALVAVRDEGFGWVARVDFKECFDSIDQGQLLDRLHHHVDDEWLLGIVALLDLRPELDGRRLYNRARGVPQGSPLSPLLCNLFLCPFDEAMLAAGYPTVRYADDSAAVAVDEPGAIRALAVARGEAARHGLELNEDKVTTVGFSEGFAFLGEDIGPVYPLSKEHSADPPPKRTVYVTAQGAHAYLKDGQLRVAVGAENALTVPVSLVGRIIMIGAVAMSAGLRSHALVQEIDVVFLSRRGGWLGRLDSGHRFIAALRRAQYRVGDDPEARVELAASFVAGKIANLRALLMRYARRDGAPSLAGLAESLAEARLAALAANDLGQLQGIEGSASREYFSGLGQLLPEEFPFTSRSRRPPRDPVNAALSFGYALLVGEVTAAVQLSGLDPAAGFLHADHDRRPSLVLDLMEEFRPILVDSVVLELFRRRSLSSEHFLEATDGPAVLLTPEGRARFLAAFEERMLTEFKHVPTDRRTSYRRALALQSTQLAQVVSGARHEYQAVHWR